MKPRTHMSITRLSTIALLTLSIVAGALGGMPAASAQDALASLTLDIYTCESRNDPIDPTESLIDQCRLGTEDIPFTLEKISSQDGSAMASTGTGGAPATISFTQLTPGDYRLTQQTPGTIALSYIAQCTSSVRTFDYPFFPFAIVELGGRLNIHLLPGEQLSCDWYNVRAEPEAAAALTITAYSCSGDVIGPGLCDLAPNVEFALTDSAGTVEHLMTGANGIATFDGSGAYHLEAISTLENREFCGFDPHTTTAGADLTLDPATPLAIDAYYCYPGA